MRKRPLGAQFLDLAADAVVLLVGIASLIGSGAVAASAMRYLLANGYGEMAAEASGLVVLVALFWPACEVLRRLLSSYRKPNA